MSRQTIERTVRSIYEARRAGDVDAVMAHVADGASFALAGCPRASPIPVACTGHASIREAGTRLTENFIFQEVEILDILVDGERAAVHLRARVRATATGAEETMEIVDLVRFEGDRVSSWTQFTDTALAARMLGA